MVRHSLKVGLSFGLTSGIITTLGLMVGMYSGTHDRYVVLGAIVTIAIADALSDAMGIHISEESECQHTDREIWESTIATFLAKFLFASTFLIPVLLLPLQHAIEVSIVWGLLVLSMLSWRMATTEHKRPWRVVAEHLFIAMAVISITNLAGKLVASVFG